MKVTIKIDKQGRILLPKVLREAAGIEPDTEISISPVRIRHEMKGLLIQQKREVSHDKTGS